MGFIAFPSFFKASAFIHYHLSPSPTLQHTMYIKTIAYLKGVLNASHCWSIQSEQRRNE